MEVAGVRIEPKEQYFEWAIVQRTAFQHNSHASK